GSTGSIGRQTLDIVRSFPDRFKVLGLAAGGNIELLSKQIAEFKPAMVYHVKGYGEAIKPDGWRFTSMEEMVVHPECEVVMVGTVGRAGLSPTLAAVNARKSVALANKEVIVMAGNILMSQAQRNGVEILPVDSEPSAMWQCMHGENKEVLRILLTASGGPFRTKPLHEIDHVTQEEALNHPTWRMGRKITIDSATLMNKGMEVIEANWLFGVPIDRIEVVIHPQSIIHSMVEFADGSVKAQMGPPDMRLPIQYSLSYPQRWVNPSLPRLNPIDVGKLTFEPMNVDRYPCFKLAIEAGKRGGTYPAVLAAADEVAVNMFLSYQVGFGEIPKLVDSALGAHKSVQYPSLEDVLDADAWAREFVAKQTAD
ncbi:MAG: 1-deoxy-D-xylulose-5-phosphate reductoisomerase, partial [Chloroflexi bacterium]|nr:1-deoxy-D-xylulose-5-phosphate reductoisomerase [Chloroflexota bacterium]